MQQSIWKKICAKISWNGPVNVSMCGKGWLNYWLRNCWFESEWGHDVIVGSIRNHTTFLYSMLSSFARVCFSKSVKINPKLNEKSRKKKLLSYQEPIFVCVSLSIWLVFIYFYCLLDNNNFNSEIFALFSLVFVLYFLLFALSLRKITLLSANQIQKFFIYY